MAKDFGARYSGQGSLTEANPVPHVTKEHSEAQLSPPTFRWLEQQEKSEIVFEGKLLSGPHTHPQSYRTEEP